MKEKPQIKVVIKGVQTDEERKPCVSDVACGSQLPLPGIASESEV